MSTNNSNNYRLKIMVGQVDTCDDNDIISQISFNKVGDLVAIGDQCGRLIIFQQSEEAYDYISQMQVYKDSHDWQKNRQLSPKVNFVQWLSSYGYSHKLITANDKIIKVWKMMQTNSRKLEQSQSSFFPIIKQQEETCKWINMIQFPNLHNQRIKDVSISHNQQFILSADKDCIYKWAIQKHQIAHPIFQKQEKYLMEDQAFEDIDFITSLSFNPTMDAIFSYSTKQGTINQIDTRLSYKSNKCMSMHYNPYAKFGSDFDQFLNVISDFKYGIRQNEIISRDYFNCYLWDLRKPEIPSKTLNIYPGAMLNFKEMLQEQLIYDQFKMDINKINGSILTQHYQNSFHQINMGTDQNNRIKLDYNNNFTSHRVTKQNPTRMNIDKFESQRKVQAIAYGPNGDKFAASCKNCAFFFENQ